MPVTMRDVAQHLGVSKQTVSAVLNGKPGISPETVARVRQAMAELGYQPNLVASSLRMGQTKTIGLMVADISNPWFSALARGVEDAAHERGYSVLLCNTYNSRERFERNVKALMQQRVAGTIGIDAADAARLAPTGKCIFHNQQRMDDRRGGYVATAHLLDLGHRHIGCITAPMDNDVGVLRTRGYREALRDWGVEVDERLIVEGAFDYQSGLHAVERLLQQAPHLTAIFALQDLAAIGAVAGLKRAGRRVPDDVAIIGYDALEITALYDPPISTIRQPTYDLAYRAMMELADKIEGKPYQQTEPIDCQLIVRTSTVPTLNQEWISPPIASGTPWNGWRAEHTTFAQPTLLSSVDERSA